MAKVKLMTAGKPLPLMLKFAVPMIFGNALQMLYNVADSTVVGRMIGIDAFAAVGVAGNLNWLVFSVVLGLSMGFGTLLAQYFGAGNKADFKRGHTMMWLITIVLGIVISVFSVLMTRPLLELMDTPPEILEDAVLYLQITFAGFIFVFATNSVSALFRAIGNSQLPVNIMVVSGVLNIVLNIVLVQYTNLGVAAVAVATVISQIVGMIIFIVFIFRTKELRVKRSDWRLSLPICKELLRLGFPIAFRNLVIAIGGVYIQKFINAYGTNFIAGISVTKRLYSLLEIIGGSLQGAAATFVAQNYGAKHFDRIKKGVRDAMFAMLVSAGAMIVLMTFFGKQIAGLMINGDPSQVEEVLGIASEQLAFMVYLLPFLFTLLLYQTAIQSMGNSILPTVGGVFEMIFRVGTVIVFLPIIGKWGLYLSEVLGWVFCSVFYIICYRVVYKQRCIGFGLSPKTGLPIDSGNVSE